MKYSRPQPLDTRLYNKVKEEAKKKFTVWPSAYASGWLTREYKRRGGRYKGNRPKGSRGSKGKRSSSVGGLTRWFAEKWIDVCSPKRRSCGRPSRGSGSLKSWMKKYPYCRPSVRVNRQTPKTSRELSAVEKKKRCSRKRKDPRKRVR